MGKPTDSTADSPPPPPYQTFKMANQNEMQVSVEIQDQVSLFTRAGRLLTRVRSHFHDVELASCRQCYLWDL